MKTGYKKRWWHDPDARQFFWACVVGFLCLAAIMWREWKATDPSRGWSPVKKTTEP